MEANKESPGAFKTPCKPAKVKSPGRVPVFKRLILYKYATSIIYKLYFLSHHQDGFDPNVVVG